MPTYTMVDGASRELTSWPAMIGGVSRELDSMIAAVGGVQREIFSGVTRWERYSVRRYFVPSSLGTTLGIRATYEVESFSADYLESNTTVTRCANVAVNGYFRYDSAIYLKTGASNTFATPVRIVSSYDTRKGDLLGIAESSNSGAYPENGLHTDGYWYVKI